ncbi:MAG TPA: M1 family metallopeptidase [Longimicrobiaceae bacterium]|nr:M1 family metallopeptidase [Longimicrobiaceae bacterium]
MNAKLTAAFAAALLAPVCARAQATAPYFQQGVRYRIEARLDEDTHVLTGRARLTYVNHSRNSLDSIYVHQHLNAFRPNSAWARRELQFGQRRFQDLGPDDHAFERFTAITVDGQPARATYPLAPDSTVAAIPLPRRLAPGDTVTLLMDWTARLASVPRRQGRAGRHYDWAQWYPRIAVYDRGGWEAHPLLPQGEFYGEFASYDVTLDLPADQVVAATGVAVAGDPGWEITDADRRVYRRGGAVPLRLITSETPDAGRKYVRFHAEDVHHFAWSIDPRYQHDRVTRLNLSEGGANQQPLPTIHVFYLPEDTAWANHVAARRTWEALTWLGGKMSPYPWPQLTNLHRLDSGGTEFPMVIMDANASEGLIVHETGHQWVHGILANNEWKEGWLDEGFTSFLTNWYFEEKNHAAGNDTADVWRNTMQTLERFERTDSVQPIALPSEAFTNFRVYNLMTYTKPSAVLRMLREYLGTPTMERVLHEYSRRYQFKHVTGEDFRRVAEEVSGRPLGWFWDQWIRRTDKLDYSVASVRSRHLARGRWSTTVVVRRVGEAWMPVDVRVGDVTRSLTSRARRQTLVVTTATKPAEVMVDPRWILIDIDRANNRAPVP